MTRYDDASLCPACLALLPSALGGQLKLSRLLRDALRLGNRLRGPALWLWLFTALGVAASELCKWIFAGSFLPSVHLGAALDTFFRFSAMTFVAALLVEDVRGTRKGVGQAFKLTLRASAATAVLVFLSQLPLLVETLTHRATVPQVSGGLFLSALFTIMSLFVPPLLAVQEPSLVRALRDSVVLLRSCFLPVVIGLTLLAGPVQLIQYGLRVALSTLLLVLAAARWSLPSGLTNMLPDAVSTVLLAPLFVYASVFRALPVLRARVAVH